MALLTIVDSLDSHSGSITALATIFLALLTAGYVVLTARLSRAQDVATRRELAEKVYSPLNLALENILRGANPKFPLWTELKDREPFLAFHRLMGQRTRARLDELTLLVTSQDGFEDKYWRLVDAVSLSAGAKLGLDTARVSGTPRVMVSTNRADRLPDIAHLTIAVRDVMTIVGPRRLDREDEITLALLDNGSAVHEVKMSAEELAATIPRLRAEIAEDDSVKALWSEYHGFLEELERLQSLVMRQLESSSR